MKILVTGANGFVGKAFCRRLLDTKERIYGLGRTDQNVEPGFKKFYAIDISHPFELNEKFDFVFHLAAHNITSVGNQGEDLYRQINIRGTENVVNAVTTRNFIFLSTAKIYAAEGKPITENSPINPTAKYEKSKLAAENICRELFTSGKLCVLRSVNIVGPGQPEKAVIPVLFKKAMAQEAMEIFGPAQSVLQFLSVEDVIDAFMKIIEQDGLAGNYNLASEQHIRLDHLAEKIKKMCRSTSEIKLTNPSSSLFSPVVATKFNQAIDWRATATIDEILQAYHHFFSSQ